MKEHGHFVFVIALAIIGCYEADGNAFVSACLSACLCVGARVSVYVRARVVILEVC